MKPSITRRSGQQTFNIATILHGLKQPEYVALTGDRGELRDGDKLLVDRLRKPRKGDWVICDDKDGYHVCEYESAKETGEIYAVVVSLVRDFRKIKRPKSPSPDKRVSQLNAALSRLERVPENEAERFRLETEIFNLEHESNTEEWPDVIGGKV
jgi:hypothetical protein